MGRTKEPEICKLCGRPITGGDPYRVNFEAMVDRAGWNMSFQPKMVICRDCSDNMLAYLEKWFKFCNKTDEYKKFGGKKK